MTKGERGVILTERRKRRSACGKARQNLVGKENLNESKKKVDNELCGCYTEDPWRGDLPGGEAKTLYLVN